GNCTLFVYGQTGSGKTHTLFGPPSCFARHLLHEAGQEGQDFPAAWGVFPRAAMQFLRQGPLTASVAEVYMNNCFDLLNNRNQVQVAGSKKCSIAAHGPEFFSKEMSSFKVAGQTQMTLQNLQDVLSLMSIVDGSRTTKSHAINDRSSRSHCIVTVTTPRTGGKFLFVDLAGSERIAKSLAPDNFLANSAGHVLDIRAEEAKNINLSLTALARVIAALAKSSPFVPFRDSVLTMMLKDSLAGNCRTAVVVTVSEDPQHQEETISSLGFARLCQSVKTEVTQLKARDAGDVVKVRQQLQQLEQQLAELEAKGGAGGAPRTEPEPEPGGESQLPEDHPRGLRGEPEEADGAYREPPVLPGSADGVESRQEGGQRGVPGEESAAVLRGVADHQPEGYPDPLPVHRGLEGAQQALHLQAGCQARVAARAGSVG
ncbi:unnamed protein product, partial [Effrenium voratum]